MQEFDTTNLETLQAKYIDPTDKFTWLRLVILFGISLSAYVYWGAQSNPTPIVLVSAGVMVLGLFVLPAWMLFVLVCLLSAMDHLPMWLNLGMSTTTEPILFKMVKDVLAIVVLLSVVKIRSPIGKKIFITYLLFAAYLFLRAITDLRVIGLVGTYLRYFIFYPLLGMMFMGAFNSIRKMTVFFRCYIFVAIAVVLLGVFEVCTNHISFYSGYVSFGPIHQRMVSSLGNPNNLGFFLQFPLLYLMSGVFLKTTRISKVIIPLLFIVIGIFLTFSRTSFVVALMGIMFISLMADNFRAFGLSVFFSVIGLGAIFIVQGGRTDGGFLGSRIDMFTKFISESMESAEVFLFGRGLGYGIVHLGIGEGVKAEGTDNILTDLLRKSGLIGMSLFVTFITSITFSCIKVWRQITTLPVKRMYLTLMAWHFVFLLFSFAGQAFILYPSVFIYWITVFWILTLPSIENLSNQESLPEIYYENQPDNY